MKLAIIVPAYNEARVISSVLRGFRKMLLSLPKEIEPDLIVIDDGSNDRTAEKARKAGARVVNHLLNLGLGGAISTGLKIAKDEGYDAAVTVDSDGQHAPEDLRTVVLALANTRYDFIIGSRWLKEHVDVPLHRRLGNKYVMNGLTLLFTGMRTSDSQSGLRGFSRQAIKKINLEPQRMEVSTELFAQAKQHRWRYKEVPIRAIYTTYSLAKGQRSLNGLAIIWRLTLSRFM